MVDFFCKTRLAHMKARMMAVACDRLASGPAPTWPWYRYDAAVGMVSAMLRTKSTCVRALQGLGPGQERRLRESGVLPPPVYLLLLLFEQVLQTMHGQEPKALSALGPCRP